MRVWLGVLGLCCVAFACAGQESEITALDKNGTLRWRALDGHVYTVQGCDGLREPWQAVPPEDQWPVGTAEWLVNGGTGWPAVGQRFYRVMAEPVSQCPPGMVLVPAGTFAMGDSFGEGFSDEFPVHTVALNSFYMAETEIPKALWDEVCDWAILNGYSFATVGASKGPEHPVHDVEWYDVVKWCNARSEKEDLTPCYCGDPLKKSVYRSGRVDVQNGWVHWGADGYRLPTEAEWEHAARGGAVGRRFPWSDADTITHARANYSSTATYAYDVSPTRGAHPDYDSGAWPYTSPVGSFPPNGFGLYDVAGNVWEWCWDWKDGYPYAASTNPRGPDSGLYRVFRGGVCGGSAVFCRVAHRKGTSPDNNDPGIGFRVVRRAP